MESNDIIKALEECIELRFDDTEYATVRLDTLTNALDLITQQQAEYENLKVENQSLRSAANSLKMHYEETQAEIEKLNAENMLTISEKNAFRTSFYDVLEQLKTAKSEAYKEFTERLKKQVYKGGIHPTVEDEFIYEIDNLLKEMVGEIK